MDESLKGKSMLVNGQIGKAKLVFGLEKRKASVKCGGVMNGRIALAKPSKRQRSSIENPFFSSVGLESTIGALLHSYPPSVRHVFFKSGLCRNEKDLVPVHQQNVNGFPWNGGQDQGEITTTRNQERSTKRNI
jgi:hypothetical protein